MGGEFWFKPKNYGFGATPITWQGWALVGVYVAIVVAATLMFVGRQKSPPAWISWIIVMVVATSVMTLASWLKTDGTWQWRWGETESSRNET
jgi:peptidoglycan/LPS O-acetylase OafA/YrhL